VAGIEPILTMPQPFVPGRAGKPMTTPPENTPMQERLIVATLAVLAIATAATLADDQDKAGPKDNRPPPGFQALFNGKDLTGWQGLVELPQRMRLSPDELARKQAEANEKVLPHWTVKDGILTYDGKANSLQTAKDYGDFELYVDWKIARNGDSGIYLRGNPQVQIWDPESKPAGGVGSGGLYNNKHHPSNPLKNADKPVGQWNHFHIVMKGDRVTVRLNGELVVDDVPLENYWEPGKLLPARGPIELQHHGDPLWFKNIYIKELD
jgi:hypothetical protein